MKYLVEITDCKITNSEVVVVYIPKSMCDDNGHVNLNGKFDHIVGIGGGNLSYVDFKTARNNNETCFLWVRAKGITSFTDINCNVEVVIRREFTLLQWVGFIGIFFYRKLTSRGK